VNISFAAETHSVVNNARLLEKAICHTDLICWCNSHILFY